MRALIHGAGALAFLALATLNSGGYRFGAADQAFYIPAVLKRLDPSLFPRDTALLEPQARYFFVDEIVAGTMRATGWSLEACFAAGYVLTLALLYVALWRLGYVLFQSPLASWALIAAETLRHRITKTGVNTLESYFHPRVLVFAIGVWAIGTYLRGRPRLAMGAILAAGLLHPTMAAFFVLFLAAAIWTTEPRLRRVVGLLSVVGLVGLAWLLLGGPMQGSLSPMDPEWRELLSAKDYLFPVRDWTAGAWIANLGTAGLAIGMLAWRARRDEGSPRERGLLAGALVLLGGFLVTLPAVSTGSALFVQLQISRVFWILDLLGTIALVWLLVEAPRPLARPPARWRQAVAAVLVVAAAARGIWVGFVEHGDRPLIAVGLPDGDWTRVIHWAEQQPSSVHLLADPGHAWRFGTPLRHAGRDVFLEEVKDTALAIYARESAARVIERREAVGDFATLDAAAARSLATRYRLDYLVIDHDLDLPLAHREGPFRIYALSRPR
ncbi:MAG: hypothetical protein AB7Q16_00930 [Vicinamibacterales bacterium]